MRRFTWLPAWAWLALALILIPATPTRADQEADPVDRALERFRTLAGDWQGTTKAGDGVRLTYEVVAGGTAVLETFDHQKHDKTMVTLYHRDGDRLMLTHYCMVGNQPRMVAESFGPDEIRFRFLDATGLESPDAGHMHAARFSFTGIDQFTTEWTFHEDGAAQFTEVVEAVRVNRASR